MLSLYVAVLVSAAPSPLQVVKSGNEQLQKLLKDGVPADKLAAKADEFIDFVELAKRALGDQWAKLKPKQRDEFAATMKGLLRASYAQKVMTEGGQGDAMHWGDEKVTGDAAIVMSTLDLKGASKPFPVEYRLYKSAKGEWRIYDVVTDDVSLVGTYSDQFQQLIAKKGYDGLLATLKKRREQLESTEKPTGATP